MPRKGLGASLASAGARMQLAVRPSTAYIGEAIVRCGGDLNEIAFSPSTMARQRSKTESDMSEKLINRFLSDSDKPNLIAHWDGKKVKLACGDIEERLAILLQAVQSNKDPQFIGVPCTADGTGASHCNAMVQLFREHAVSTHRIIGMCCDTTASNTGKENGAATLLELPLGRALLWLVYLHHIAELHITWADHAV